METHYLVLNSNRNEIPKFDILLEQVNNVFNLSMEKFINLQIAASEALINAIVHGNKENPGKNVYIVIEHDENILNVKIKDEGDGFEVDKLPDPTSNENIMKEHGRGIYIIRSLVDDFECNSSSSGTEYILSVRK